jgi:hypothetical protein
MTEMPIRFVTTGPLRVARVSAFGPVPEPEAFKKLDQWATPKGLLKDPSAFLLLGRNNPPPPPDGGDYGYEYLLTIGPDVDTTGVDALDITQTTYAVIRANFRNITARWRWLYEWAEGEGYSVTGHGFEEHLTLPERGAPEDMLFDLWLPVEKQSARG